MKTKKINIPIDQQVPPVDISKELTEKLASVGIEVESAYYWVKFHQGKWQISENGEGFDCYGTFFNWEESHKTYTLPELLEVLPEIIAFKGDDYWFNLRKGFTQYANYKNTLSYSMFSIGDDNPATAAAKLLIWCIDNGYIKGGGE